MKKMIEELQELFSAVEEDGGDVDVSRIYNCPRSSKTLTYCSECCIGYYNCSGVSLARDVLTAYEQVHRKEV